MEYEYLNKFNLSNAMAETLSIIISDKEKADYVCKIIKVNTVKHKEMVFKSPLEGYHSYGGGLNSLSGAQIATIDELYGTYIEDIIPSKSYSYMMVIEKEAYKLFSKLTFRTKEEIESALKAFCIFYEGYAGTFDSDSFTHFFPYLQDFFKYLDEWRIETGRVTVDVDILTKGAKMIIDSDYVPVKSNNQ